MTNVLFYCARLETKEQGEKKEKKFVHNKFNNYHLGIRQWCPTDRKRRPSRIVNMRPEHYTIKQKKKKKKKK